MIKLLTPFDWFFCLMAICLYAGSVHFFLISDYLFSAYWLAAGIYSSWQFGRYIYNAYKVSHIDPPT